jgi:hypothetical protein
MKLAIKAGLNTIVKALLNHKASVESIPWQKSLLHYAAEKDNVEVGRLLIENKANVNHEYGAIYVRQNGPTPLCSVCNRMTGGSDFVDLLISNKAEVNHRETVEFNEGRTPIQMALLQGNKDVFKKLLYAGAEVSDYESEQIIEKVYGKFTQAVRRKFFKEIREEFNAHTIKVGRERSFENLKTLCDFSQPFPEDTPGFSIENLRSTIEEMVNSSKKRKSDDFP